MSDLQLRQVEREIAAAGTGGEPYLKRARLLLRQGEFGPYAWGIAENGKLRHAFHKINPDGEWSRIALCGDNTSHDRRFFRRKRIIMNLRRIVYHTQQTIHNPKWFKYYPKHEYGKHCQRCRNKIIKSPELVLRYREAEYAYLSYIQEYLPSRFAEYDGMVDLYYG